MSFLKLKGLKARLLAIVLLAMLPVLCMALYMAVDDYAAAKREALSNARRLTVSYAATGNALIERARLLMEQSASMAGPNFHEPGACQRIVDILSNQHAFVRRVGVYRRNGSSACANAGLGGANAAPANVSREFWLQEALHAGAFTIGHYREAKEGGELPLALPLADADGVPRHVLYVSLNLATFQHVLDDQALPDGASASVIDSEGTILARYPWTASAVGKSAPGSEGVLPDLRHSGQDSWEADGVDGVRRIYFLSHLAGGGGAALFLRVGMPTERVLADARRSLTRNLLFIGLMTAVVLVATWFFSNSLVLRHIRTLWLATRKLSEGDYAYRIGATGGGELGELALAFDQMAGTLEGRTDELARAELKYREMFENSAAGIFRATPGGRLHDANRAMARLLGYNAPQELIEHMRDIGSDLYAEPGRRDMVLERLDAQGAVSGMEFTARRRNGSLVWLSLDAHAVRASNGSVAYYEGMVSDITRRREVEQELCVKQEKLQALLDYSPALICVKDRAGRYLVTNRQHDEVHGAGQSMAGKRVTDVFPPDVARKIMDEDALVLEGATPMTYQRPLKGARDARHFVTVKFPLYDGNGRPDRVGSISYDVTDLERTREALRRSEEKYRIMIQTSPDLIWLIDPKGVLVEVNSASRDLIGFEPEELRGRHFHQFFQPQDVREHDRELVLPALFGKTPPDGQPPKLINERRRMPRSTRNLNLKLVAKQPDGQTCPSRDFELSACGLWQDMRFAGTIVVIRDITERLRAEAALRSNQELLDQTQSLARIGGWSQNLDTGERGWTGETSRLLGSDDGPMPDIATWQEFLALEDCGALREAIQDAGRTGASFNLELRLAHGAGRPGWVRIMARRADADGERILTGVVQDISERKELERLKADIDTIIRHDLKTPLNGIINLPQLIRGENNLNPEQLEYLQLIEDSGRSMLRQVDMSLDLMKIELGRYVCAPSACDLVPVLREALAALRDAAAGKEVAFTVTLDGQPPTPDSAFTVWGEERLCHPILSNLLLNALEASPVGGRVDIRLERVECARVVIRNSGEVPSALREHFFEKYATSGKTTGTGLGTYSAQLFAEAQGGRVELDAAEPGATTLIVRLPRA